MFVSQLPVFDMESIDRHYEFFRFVTEEKYFQNGARFVDQASDIFKAKSICFNDGRDFIVMLPADPDNWNKIKSTMGKYGNKSITVQPVKAPQIETRHLFQLFLNSLATYDTEKLSFSNLTGRLYCYKDSFVEKMRNDKEAVAKIHAFEISITEDLLLSVQIKTFTSALLKDHIEYAKKQWEDYPKYVQTNKSTLKRAYSKEEGLPFIMRQTRGCRFGSVKFLSIKNRDEFEKSKAGVIEYVVRELKRKYSDCMTFSFESFETAASILCRPMVPMKRAETLKNVLASMDLSVKLIDKVQTEESERVIKEIKNILLETYEVKSIIGKRYSDGFLNIQLIHDASFYQMNGSEMNNPVTGDPYINNKKIDADIQNITIEKFSELSGALIEKIISELIIKHDLSSGRVSICNWASFGIDRPMTFYTRQKIEENRIYKSVTIMPDGSISIFFLHPDNLFEIEEYQKVDSEYEIGESKGSTVVGVIRDVDGQIYSILETKKTTIPDVEAIKRSLELNGKVERSKESRNTLMYSILDICSYREPDGSFSYYVGTVGSGMNSLIKNAVHIRKLSGMPSEEFVSQRLLPLMNMMFIRNGQLTVLPFPFKYLREMDEIE